MLDAFFTRLAGTGTVLAHLPGQRGIPYLAPERLQKKRDARVRRIVRYAAATVPYYRQLFRQQGIDPRDIRGADDLDRLPLLEKAWVRADPEHFRSQSRSGRRAIPFETSGSTRSPLTAYHDPMSVAANLAFCEPEKEVVRRFFGRGRPVRQISIYYPGSSVLQIWDVYRRITFVPPPAEHLVLSVTDPLDKVVAALNAFRPDLLIGYGSYLESLFRMAHARQITLHPPKLVMYGADMMTEPGKRLIEEQFGIPVYSRYRAVESFQIGFTCEKGQGFHIRGDLCDMKLVGAQGQRVPAGEPGEIVISNFVNRGTVLLNYRLGDVGVMSGAPCGCGRTLPVLTGLLGRAEDALILADGRIVDPRLVWNVFKDRPEIVRYQLVQHEPARFALKLVTTDREAYDRIGSAVAADLRELLGSVRIDTSFCERLESSASGKFRPVVSHCSAGAPR